MPSTRDREKAALRVVVADDDPGVLRAIEWLLKRASFEVVHCVATGEELVDAALAHQPDVIVSDAMIPAFFGSEAVQRLRRAGPFAFVLVSETPRDIQQWIEQGASCVVHTMDLDTDLAAAVEAAAASEIYISRRAIDIDQDADSVN